MIPITGQYAEAKIFTDNVESGALQQIYNLCNQSFAKNSTLRFMPDVHMGKGCTVGTTITISDKICPNLVGVDIGCGMLTYILNVPKISFEKLDDIIRNKVPFGSNIHTKPLKPFLKQINLEDLKCFEYIDYKRAKNSIGSLGGGNHFIEVNKSSKDQLYLVIHSGSRYLGQQVCKYYQNKAIHYHKALYFTNVEKATAQCTENNTLDEIPLIKKELYVPPEFAYLEGQDFDDYIHDMKIVQRYAELNREAMGHIILSSLGISTKNFFHTTHNYIDTEHMILRKGAISAQENELVLIPINMSDGSLLCKGKGNPDWNFSAPHGAGRLYSRSEAKNNLDFTEFEKSMKNVYSTCVRPKTLDEAPQAYKPIKDILDNIGDCVDVIEQLKPIYNFKP
ncbi:MAG: RNA-splicing ligase RtcB [Epulopiscium sp. Nele67-Bin005]|nr:MAG: RNA-splicing ligase RtcB [Epulopiscium sp. Nele67-Bin005]